MKITVKKYDENWKAQFEIERDNLNILLKKFEPKIEHIGSTSIENCAAKPIIDILIGVENELILNRIIPFLVQSDFVYFKIYEDIFSERKFFVKYNEITSFQIINNDFDRDFLINNTAKIHLHCTIYKNYFWNRHIAFRDYLRTHENDRISYSCHKLQLSTQYWIDGNEYNVAKNHLVKEIEQKALIWYLNK